MIVIAHRGASAEVAENTIAAFARALEIGADMIELDVRVSRDGVLYVSHDPVLDGRHPAWLHHALDWAEIRARADGSGSWPALAEVLDAIAGRIPLNLELKERRAAALLVEELRRRSLRDGILVSSFDRRATRQVRALAPHLALGLLARRLPFRLRAAVLGLGARALHPHRRAVGGRVLRLARELAIPVYVWTVDEPEEVRRLAALGVAGVFTNDPRRVLALLGRGGASGSPRPSAARVSSPRGA